MPSDIHYADFKSKGSFEAPNAPGSPLDLTAMDGIPDTDSQKATQNTAVSWKKLFAFTTRQHGFALTMALLGAALVAGVKTVLAVMLGKVFDVIADFGSGSESASTTLSNMTQLCVILIGLGVANWAASSLFLASWIVFGELQAASVRLELFKSILFRDMAWFDSLEQGISSLSVRIQTQARELQLATSQVFGLLASDVITAAASLVIAFYYSWKLTLVLLATLPVSAAILSYLSRRLEPAIQAQRRELAVASQHTTASLTAIDLVKVFNGSGRELRQYSDTIKRASVHYLVQARCNAIQMAYVSFWLMSMFIVGISYGVVLVKQGLNPGHVLTTFYSTLATMQSIEALMPQWLVLAKGMSAGNFLSSLLSEENVDDSTTLSRGSELPRQCKGTVELDNVSFAYPSNPDTPALRRSSFLFPAGSLTFIVGKSGSGKSTLGNLISSLYPTSTGDVRIDGTSLPVLGRDWVREHVALIQQTSVVFSDTFFNNVALGHRNPEQATREEVLEACDAALLHSTIAGLPLGLDTKLGSGGHNLSGGQKQRLALARARLRNPPVVVLDEVTSGLDPVSRVMVMESIREWRRGKTTIVITHDVSQIDDDDFVYVMDQSSLVQQGLKHNLCHNSDGYFASLVAPSGGGGPQITVTSPQSTNASDRPPSSDTTPHRLSRFSQLIIDEIAHGSSRPGSFSLPQRSLGLSTDQALRMQTEAFWGQPLPENDTEDTSLSMKHTQDDIRRFSAFVESHFSPTRGSTLFGWKDQPFRLEIPSRKPSIASKQAGSLGEIGANDEHLELESLRQGPRVTLNADDHAESRDSSATNSHRPSNSLTGTLKTVWPAIGRRDKVMLIMGLVSCLLVSVVTPSFSYCFAHLLSALWLPQGKMEELRKWSPILVAIAVVDVISTFCSRYLLEMVAQSWVNGVRTEALNRILSQPRQWFDKESHAPGRINECLDRNAEEMRNIVGRFVPIVTCACAMILASVLWSMAVSWKLTLVALAPLPIFLGSVKGYSYVNGIWETRCNNGAEDTSACWTEVLLSIRVVRALSLEGYFSQRYRRLTWDTLGLGKKKAAYTCSLYGLYQSLNYGITALVFYYGTHMITTDPKMTATQVLQVVNLLLFGMGSAVGMLISIPQLTLAQATAAKLLAYANMSMEPPEGLRGTRKLSSPLPVGLNNLDFAYPSRPKALSLRGVSFDINPGCCTAIVGHSGCGKSTVVSLLLGLYTPRFLLNREGLSPLTFAGESYSQIDIEQLRTKVAYVSQAPFLFPTTVAENIAYGLNESSPYRQRESTRRAAQAADIDEFIMSLPQGYDTVVGEGGQTLSGGQAQRLSIARALLRRPSLLVLDEPTSALDAESADMIRRTLSSLIEQNDSGQGGMAIVLVTHSKEMMRVAGKIVVLENGAKVEEGTYDELQMSNGTFAHMLRGEDMAV